MLHVLDQMLNGAFEMTLEITMTYIVYSIYNHFVHLYNTRTRHINPETVLSNVEVDKDLLKTVLDDLINNAKQLDELAEETLMKHQVIPPTPANLYAPVADELVDNFALDFVPVKSYTIRELKRFASSQKIKGYSNMTKSQLLKVVTLP